MAAPTGLQIALPLRRALRQMPQQVATIEGSRVRRWHVGGGPERGSSCVVHILERA